jgi:hypothetical protein
MSTSLYVLEKFQALDLGPNAARSRPFRDRPESLRRIAIRLIDKAEEGDLASILELIDRLDGKGRTSD